jgi:hypothetical protein
MGTEPISFEFAYLQQGNLHPKYEVFLLPTVSENAKFKFCGFSLCGVCKNAKDKKFNRTWWGAVGGCAR